MRIPAGGSRAGDLPCLTGVTRRNQGVETSVNTESGVSDLGFRISDFIQASTGSTQNNEEIGMLDEMVDSDMDWWAGRDSNPGPMP